MSFSKTYQEEVLSKRVPKNPGSRGGVGYWTGNGTWKYGQRPSGQKAHPEDRPGEGRKKKTQVPAVVPSQQEQKSPGGQQGSKGKSVLQGTMFALGGVTMAYKMVAWVKTERPPKEVRQIQQDLLKKYNYMCTDKANVFSTDEGRIQSWDIAKSQIDFFHKKCPLWNSFVKKHGVSFDMSSSVSAMSTGQLGRWAEYAGGGQSISQVRRSHGTLFHELTHAADNLYSPTEAGFSTESLDTPFGDLVKKLQETKEHQDFIKKHGGSKNEEYYKSSYEVLARFGEAVLMREWEKQAKQTKVQDTTLWGQTAATSIERVTKNQDESWSPQTLDTLGPIYLEILKYGDRPRT